MVEYKSSTVGYAVGASATYSSQTSGSVYSIKPKMICCGSHLRGQRCFGCPSR